jgi:predicted nucleic acid-binding protein
VSSDLVVVNASPLIILFKSLQAELLPQLFAEIVLPQAMLKEVVAAGAEDVAAKQVPITPWLTLVAESVVDPRVAAWDLGAGEAAVLSYALSSPGYRAMVDDRAARRCAKSLEIPVLGTGGMLVLAKRRGLVPSVEPGLEAIRTAGLWLSDEVVALLKKEAGE